MKDEGKARQDDFVDRICELAKGLQNLARKAVQDYSMEVEAILKERDSDAGRIERCLDGMLDFCFDDDMLGWYKKLCRYYFDIDPKIAAFYVYSYREMWDESEPGNKKAPPSAKINPAR
ncbi:MAG: hypothetical protein KKF30_06405 [Proteobacteria bacterium]|nr:hypothetical protein [Pseudomonadota bacterium]MBU4470196.1 hypothetical protein [Pseudomonadota bacterium]MCG2752612.1 hypothetical protein [Desulfobacteraceae bacterium]